MKQRIIPNCTKGDIESQHISKKNHFLKINIWESHFFEMNLKSLWSIKGRGMTMSISINQKKPNSSNQ